MRFYLAATLPAPGVDPLALTARRGDLSVYWQDPSEASAAAGYGVLAAEQADHRDEAFELMDRLCGPTVVQGLRNADGPAPPGPWFGGLAFDLARAPGPSWSGFPAARWILPELLLWNSDGQSFLTAFARAEGTNGDGQAALRARVRELAGGLPRNGRPARARRHLRLHRSPQRWTQLVERALQAIDDGALVKVVTARAVEAEADRPFDPLAVLEAIRRRAPPCVAFLFRGEGGAIFAGATPETLCRVRGREVETEALAGSSRPEDSAVGLHGDKEQREHDEVTRAIVAGLSPLCESLEVGQPEVLHLPNVSHLRTAIRGRLKEGRGPAQVAQALHPTPAVGGTPRDRALSFLAEHEELDRGWYAGVVGWLGEGAANLKTALRCALVQKDRARIFVGAGLVKGSTPDGEWAETEAKAVAMLEALAG